VVKTGFALIGLASLGSLLIAYGSSAGFADGGFGYDFMNNYFPGDYSPPVKMIILGRILFGMGLETCCVMVQKVIVKWFKGKELALAFAINMGVGRLGTSFALWLPAELAGDLVNGIYPKFSTPLWFGFILSGLAILVFLVYTVYDVKLDKHTEGMSSEE
ncbi:MAG: major facilitator superfamily domain-containing protein 1, partial [bacterium]|nr:major facilitator superfamily domain-containing protein 1 [bacterium]